MFKLRQIYPAAKVADIYLGDNMCTGDERPDGLHFQQGLRECRTSETSRNDAIVYSNRLVYAEHDPIFQFIIRYYNWTYGVECDMSRNETLSGHIHHEFNRANHPSNIVTRHYIANVTYYLDPNFMFALPANILQVPVGTQIYVKVYTDFIYLTDKMKIQTCYTKAVADYIARDMDHYIIDNGCEVDNNTHIISESARETRLVYKVMSFHNESFQLICYVFICDINDYSPQCQRCR